jgi:hypothetical protein
MSVTLDGVTIDNTIGSPSRLAEAIWLVDVVKRHEGGQQCHELLMYFPLGTRPVHDQDETPPDSSPDVTQACSDSGRRMPWRQKNDKKWGFWFLVS